MKKHLSNFGKIIVILGPTSSGKSELAVKIARYFNGEIISADSRQVYKRLDIGSGKVPRDKTKSYRLKAKSYFYKGIPHHLLDVASPKRIFTVSQYQKLAKKKIQEILKTGKLPIICGGTGLYIDALIYDYQLPSVPPRPKLRKQLNKKTTEGLFQQLQKLDPRRARNIDKNNRRRLIRALEIVLITKKPVPALASLSGSISKKGEMIPPFNVLKIGIEKPPEELKKLIAKRLKGRLRQGLIKEVGNLHLKEDLSWKRLDDLGLEYRYVSRYLRGLINKKEMIGLILKESRQYAKRQVTWFKRDKSILWIKKSKEAEKLIKNFLD